MHLLRDYFIAATTIYFACFFYSTFRTYLGYGSQTAYLTPVDGTDGGQLIQISIPITPVSVSKKAFPIGLHWQPTRHMFLRFNGVGLSHGLSSHPFTISSLPPFFQGETAELKFLIGASPNGDGGGGLTGVLSSMARERPGCSVKVSLDGPYGGWKAVSKDLEEFDRVLIVAGGSGAGFTLPLIEHILRATLPDHHHHHHHECAEDEKDAISRSLLRPRVKILFATRSASVQVWYEAEINRLLAAYSSSSATFEIELHVTKDHVADEKAALEVLHRRNSTNDLMSDPAEKTPSITSDEKGVSPSAAGMDHIQPSSSSSVPAQSETKKTTCCSSSSNNKPTAINEPPRSEHVSRFQGRPDLSSTILSLVNEAAGQSIAIASCGPPSMQYDVSNAAAEAQRIVGHFGAVDEDKMVAREVYLHAETFS